MLMGNRGKNTDVFRGQSRRSGQPRASLSDHMRLIGARRMGRVQLQCRRALIALSRVRIGDLLAWCYPKAKEFKHWHRKSIHRAILKVGVPVGQTRARHGHNLGAEGRNMMQHVANKCPLAKRKRRLLFANRSEILHSAELRMNMRN
jgi:hypothetical protein